MKHIPRSDPATMPSPRPLLMRIFRQGTAKRKRGKQRDPRNPDQGFQETVQAYRRKAPLWSATAPSDQDIPTQGSLGLSGGRGERPALTAPNHMLR